MDDSVQFILLVAFVYVAALVLGYNPLGIVLGVLVLGLTYRPGIAETRATPALPIVDHLDDAGVERTHLVGASLGGMIAQRYVLDYDRAESLALLCTTPGGDDAVPIPEETQARMLAVPDEYGPSETIRHKMEPAFTEAFWADNQDVVDRIVDWRLETDPSEDAYEWQSAAAVGFDASDELGAIDLPTLVLHGTADRVLPVENGRLLSEGIPGAELVEVEGGSHLFFVEQDERVTAEIREFVTDG